MKDSAFIIDYIVHGGGYACQPTLELFGEKNRLQRWLDVEVALVRVQSKLGIVPKKFADEISAKADIKAFDLRVLKEQTIITKHSLMPLINALESRCSPEARAFIHFGATTQDIQDTAMSIEIRDFLALLRVKILDLVALLIDLAERSRDLPMAGRTHSMPGSPITLGLKVAGWLDEIQRLVERIDQAVERMCCVQMFGSVGSLASFEGRGTEINSLLAQELGLSVARTSWHASRDRFAEFIFLTSLATAAVARFADELRTLNRLEVREVIMGFQVGEIGSTCMPHKRNPEDAEQVVVLSRLVRSLVSPSLEAMHLEHERDYRGTRMEWPIMMQACHYSYAAYEHFNKMISLLFVNEEKITENVNNWGQFLFVENLLLTLTKRIGRADAYDIVYELTQISQEKEEDVKTRALRDVRLKKYFSNDELVSLFDITQFLGESQDIVTRALADARSLLQVNRQLKKSA